MKRIFLALALASVVSGCGFLGGAVDLDGSWRLERGVDRGTPLPIPLDASITMNIAGAEIGGHSACNIYGGTVTIHGSSVAIDALSMTEMACAEELMAAEAAYMAALPRVESAIRNGNSLVLSGPDLELRFVQAADGAGSSGS